MLLALAQQEGVAVLDAQTLGECSLARVVTLPPDAALGTLRTAGSPITLLAAEIGEVQSGQILPLVLYWRAEGPVTKSYTVFTQLFDPSGRLAAQQDNLPVTGLAPTDTWQPGSLIRDPYRLALPADAAPGQYSLHVGLYDAEGQRAPVQAAGSAAGSAADGPADHFTLPVQID